MSSEFLLTQIIAPLVFYVAGILTGFYIREFSDKTINYKDKGNTLVLLSVTTIWVLSMLIDFLSPDYITPIPLHGLMGAIVGFFYKPTKT